MHCKSIHHRHHQRLARPRRKNVGSTVTFDLRVRLLAREIPVNMLTRMKKGKKDRRIYAIHNFSVSVVLVALNILCCLYCPSSLEDQEFNTCSNGLKPPTRCRLSVFTPCVDGMFVATVRIQDQEDEESRRLNEEITKVRDVGH